MPRVARHTDSFTDTALLDLISHTPDLGSGWANAAGAGVRPTIDTAGTGCRNGGDNRAYITTTLANNQYAKARLKNVSSLTTARLYTRFTNNGTGFNAGTGYIASVNRTGAGANLLSLQRSDDGSVATLGEEVVSWVNNDLLDIEAVATDIAVTVNGTPEVDAVDATYGSGGAALFNETGADPCWDDFEAGDVESGLTPNPAALGLAGQTNRLGFGIHLPDEA